MRSKLEPGCMAMIVGGVVKSNHGMIVKVGNFIGDPLKGSVIDRDLDIWEVNKLVTFRNIRAGVKTYNTHYMASGKTMQRIDDNETKCLSEPAHITGKA